MKKASRVYNFCFISKRHVVFNWQSVGHIKTELNAQRNQKNWNKFIFWLFKCLKFLPSRFTVLVTHSITCIILQLSNIIICFKTILSLKTNNGIIDLTQKIFQTIRNIFFFKFYKSTPIYSHVVPENVRYR